MSTCDYRVRYLLVLFVTAIAACGEGSTVERGFGSRQLLSIRDSSIVGFDWWDADVWRFSVAAKTGGSGREYWSLDFATGEAADLGSVPPDAKPSSLPGARYQCQTSYGMPTSTTSITDTQTGELTVIDRVAFPFDCPTESDPTIRVWRLNDSGTLTIWLGPFRQIAEVPLDLTIRQIVWLDYSGAKQSPSFRVLAARPSQPDGLGLFSIDADTLNVTEIVPARIETADWATGATAEGTLDSPTLSAPLVVWSAGPGLYAYQRVMSDGGTTMFAGPFSSGPRERALFRSAGGTGIQSEEGVITADSSYVGGPVWQYQNSIAGDKVVSAWNVNQQRLTTCPSPFSKGIVAERAGNGDWWPVRAKSDISGGTVSGPLLLIGPGIYAPSENS